MAEYVAAIFFPKTHWGDIPEVVEWLHGNNIDPPPVEESHFYYFVRFGQLDDEHYTYYNEVEDDRILVIGQVRQVARAAGLKKYRK